MKKDPLDYRIDLVVARLGSPRCLVIGAMDGIQFDTLGPRIQAKNWPATFVEPNPAAFKQLKKNFKNNPNAKFHNVAIGEPGTMDLYYVDPKVYQKDPNLAWMQGISTLNPNVGDMAHLQKEFILKKTVPVVELDSVMDGEDVNILQIDTEGYDAKILMQFPFENIQPQLIIMERIHITPAEYTQVRENLNALGYHLTETEFDLLATRKI